MKKFFPILLSLVLFAPSALAASFPDVAEDHKNYQAIEYLDEKEIIQGYKDGTFGPNNLVKRSEAIKILVEAFDLEVKEKYEGFFPDVKSDQWFFKYVMAGYEKQIIKGYEDGNFKPDEKVNLAETLKMLSLAAKISAPEVKDFVFVDVDKDQWFAGYSLYAKEHNLIIADDEGKIYPDQAMTRSSFAELVYRMKIVLEQEGKPFPIEKNWSYYESSILPFKIKYNDKSWQILENKNEVIIWKADKQLAQSLPSRIYPNSASVRFNLDENKLKISESQYFANVKKAFADSKQTAFDLQGLSALEILYPEKRIVDWYVYLNDGSVLAVYTEFGPGTLGFALQQEIKAMLSTLEYKEINKNQKAHDELLNKIFAAVLVEGKGNEILNTVPDKSIIETDTIGVGTGPVDYYYSAELEYTFKYERSADVILDSRKGKTTKF